MKKKKKAQSKWLRFWQYWRIIHSSSSSDLGRLWLHGSSLPWDGEALGTPGALLSVPRKGPCSWEPGNSRVQPLRSASCHTAGTHGREWKKRNRQPSHLCCSKLPRDLETLEIYTCKPLYEVGSSPIQESSIAPVLTWVYFLMPLLDYSIDFYTLSIHSLHPKLC